MDKALLTIFVLSAVRLQEKKKKVMHKCWVKNWLQKEEIFSYINLLNELRSEPEDWWNHMRMDETMY